MNGLIVSVNLSAAKHEKKAPAAGAELVENLGLAGDAHAEGGPRQVSLLAEESVAALAQTAAGRGAEAAARELLVPGAFAENLTTRGLALAALPVRTRLAVGSRAILEISQIGKECRRRCAIFDRLGDCAMPRAGVFARVLKGGPVKPGDEIRVRPARPPGGSVPRGKAAP